jgi:hypothetical protein
MMSLELTRAGSAATTPFMGGPPQNRQKSGWRAVRAAVVLAAGASAISGCISVNAPDKPIVIELNINIKQEVIYRLAKDAGTAIDNNPGIF